MRECPALNNPITDAEMPPNVQIEDRQFGEKTLGADPDDQAGQGEQLQGP
jgi:hypothetical protein